MSRARVLDTAGGALVHLLARSFIFGCALLLGSSRSWAARPARIDVSEAGLLEAPRADANTIISLRKGAPIAISNEPIGSYFKARTAAGDLGFVAAESIQVYDFENRATQTPFVATDKVRVRLGGGSTFLQSSGILGYLELPAYRPTQEYFVQLSYLFRSDFALHLAVSYLSKPYLVTDAETESVYPFQITGIPVQLGITFPFIRSRVFQLGAFGMGGYDFASKATFGEVAFTPGSWIVTAGVELELRFDGRFSLFLQPGYRWQKSDAALPTATGAGENLFANADGDFLSQTLFYSGPILLAGLGFSF